MSLDVVGAEIPGPPAQRFRTTGPRYAGVCSVLYEGVDPASGHAVLVKVLRETAFASAAERHRIKRELQKLSQLRHASLAPVLAVGEDDGKLWFARDLVEGESLSERIERTGCLSASEVARIGARVSAALGELHRGGLLHRDLRPGHVIVGNDDRVALIDVCVGRIFKTIDGRTAIGTPGYVAPETIAGKLVSFRSDLYSLGATLFEAVAASPPFGPSDSPRALVLQTEGDPPSLSADVPVALARLIHSLMSREPRERPFSAQQLEKQLEPLAFTDNPAEISASTTVGLPPDEDLGDATVVAHTDDNTASSRPAAGQPAKPNAATDFDDDSPTQVGDGLFEAAAAIVAAGAPIANSPPTTGPALSPSRSPVRTPTPAPARAAPPVPPSTARATTMPPLIRAPTSPPIAPARISSSTMPATASAPRKPTLMGVSPDLSGRPQSPAASAPVLMPPFRPGADRVSGPAPPPGARIDEASGSVRRPPERDAGNDFDDFTDTVVAEDSRIFGVPEFANQRGHGTAVPPLPDGVAARVLTGTPVSNPGLAGAPATPGSTAPSLPAFSPPRTAAPVSHDDGQNDFDDGAPTVGLSRTPNPAGLIAPAPSPPLAGAWSGSTAGGWGPGAAVGTPGFAPAPSGAITALAPPGVASPMRTVSTTGSTSGASASRQSMGIRSRWLWPWILAGVGVAALAGATGFFVARGREAAPAPAGASTAPTAAFGTPPGGTVPTALPAAPGIPSSYPTNAMPGYPTNAMPGYPTNAMPVAPQNGRPVAPVPAPTRAPATPPVAFPVRRGMRHPTPAPAAAPAVRAPIVPAPRGAGDPIALARQAMTQRDWETARALLRQAERAQPRSAEVHYLLGDVAARMRDLPGAIGELRNAVRMSPTNTSYLHRLADVQVAWSDRAGAAATLRRVLEINPRDMLAQQQLDLLTRGARTTLSPPVARTIVPTTNVPLSRTAPRPGTRPGSSAVAPAPGVQPATRPVVTPPGGPMRLPGTMQRTF